MEQPMLGDTKSDAVKRINYIDGHLSGVRKMIEEDRYCVDVIRQTYAIRRAIQKLEGLLIDGHLRSCVPDAYREGRDEEMREELKDLFEISER
jgi:DNA-binding FrmR family transcriptional regulator